MTIEFPSPSGALMFLTRVILLVVEHHVIKVSVPFRGFDVSNMTQTLYSIYDSVAFPSPSGALMFLTGRAVLILLVIYLKFPSPSGALMFLTLFTNVGK